MQDKHKKLLLYLYNKNDWTTAKTLSSALGVSVRTIKNYIKQINSIHNNTVISSQEGYLFNQEYTFLLKQTDEKTTPQTSEERSIYLLNYLLQSNTPISFYDLCDELYISESTLKTDLKTIRKKLYEMDLQLKTNNNQIQIVGIEKNKRKLLSKLLYEESNSNFLDLKTIENAFPNIDITFIDQVMIKVFNKYHWFINDYSKINILLHTTIAIDRLKADEKYMPVVLSEEQRTSKEYQIANNIGKQLATHFQVPFDQREIYELSLLISSYTTNINYQEATLENIQKIVGKESYDLAKEVIDDISRYFYIDLNEPQFFIRFVLHIFNLIRRAKNNVIINNPLAANIKERCPLIYECAVTASHLIQERINYPITDDEIGYIAFHIGGALEAQKKIEDIINVVLLFPQYYDLDQSLASLIEEKFKDEILVKNVIASEEMIHEQNCDLVLSMIPVNHIYDKPILSISPFLQDRDFDNIKNELNKIKSEKKQKEFEQLLDYMLNKDMFYINKEFKNREETIDFMADTLEANNYVTSCYKKEVLHREKMSSTAFGKIAIPHAMKLNAKKSGMCLILNNDKHKIPWGSTEVNIVLMLAISKSDRKMFLDLFDSLTMILTEDENISKLISATSYKEFKNVLVGLS